MTDIDVEQAFMAAVWDALKADANDLRKQQRILAAFRDAVPSLLARAEAAKAALSAERETVARLEAALRVAHDTLWEINPNNYDHDEVCRLNDACVEVILGIAPLIGEMHGKSPEWWEARAALTQKDHTDGE